MRAMVTNNVSSCLVCDVALPADARYCPACGADQRPSRGDNVNTTAAIGVAALLGILGLVFIPLSVVLWRFLAASEGAGDQVAAAFGAIAFSIAALGVMAADFAFVSHLRDRGALEWAWWSQLIIIPVWLFAFIAILIAVTGA